MRNPAAAQESACGGRAQEGQPGSVGEVELSLLARQLFFQIMDDLSDIRVHFHAIFNQPAGMQDSSMIAAAECLSDRVQVALRNLEGEKHGQFARKGDV